MLVAGELGIFAVEVIALDADARRFYQKYGFAELADDDLHLYLPIKMIERLGLGMSRCHSPPSLFLIFRRFHKNFFFFLRKGRFMC